MSTGAAANVDMKLVKKHSQLIWKDLRGSASARSARCRSFLTARRRESGAAAPVMGPCEGVQPHNLALVLCAAHTMVGSLELVASACRVPYPPGMHAGTSSVQSQARQSELRPT